MSWPGPIPVGDGSDFMVANSTDLYVSNNRSNSISKINLITGVVTTLTGFNGPRGLALTSDYLYVANAEASTICKVSLSTFTIESQTPTDDGPINVLVDGAYLYVACVNANKVLKYNIPSLSLANLGYNVTKPNTFAISNGFLYIGSQLGTDLIRVNTTTDVMETKTIFTFTRPLVSMVASSTSLYISYRANSIMVIDLSNFTAAPTTIDTSYVAFGQTGRLAINNDSLFVFTRIVDDRYLKYNLSTNTYVSTITIPTGEYQSVTATSDYVYAATFGPPAGNAYRFPLPAPLLGDVCFPAETPVETDQGVVSIANLMPGVHTIRNNPIIAITRTTMRINTFLVCIEKGALGENCPNQTTLSSPHHKIEYNGELIEAYNIANLPEFEKGTAGIYRIAYEKQPLYNVVMEEHTTMKVNNMTVETLHPGNKYAKMFTS